MSLTETTEAGCFLSESFFRILSTKELETMSVCRVTNTESFNCLGHPTPDGMYAPSLGPEDDMSCCGTCSMNKVDCPGHFGHIKLPLPVFHPVLFDHMYEIVLGICTSCQDFHGDPRAVLCCELQLKALKQFGDISLAERLAATYRDHIHSKTKGYASLAKLQELYDDLTANQTPSLKMNVFENRKVAPARAAICKEFVKNHFRNRAIKCKKCENVLPHVVQEYKNKILLRKKQMKPRGVEGGGSGRSKKTKKKVVIKNNHDDDDDDDDEDKDDDLEMDVERKTTISDEVPLSENKLLTPQLVNDLLRHAWKLHGDMLAGLYPCLSVPGFEKEPVDIFFMKAVAVPPVRFRPLNFVRGAKIENPQSMNLIEVLKEVQVVEGKLIEMKKLDVTLTEAGEKSVAEGGSDGDLLQGLYKHWTVMQQNVNAVYDGTLNKLAANPRAGVKQILEKKTGLFRMNLMGKRVDYAARSVISPDPYIGVNEVGIPYIFAKKLTFREAVNHYNVNKLKRLVINGPDVHPGATQVEYVNKNGQSRVFLLKKGPENRNDRISEADKLMSFSTVDESSGETFLGNKFVHRHVLNGDALLLNRQPTLHRPSIMAHRARVLPNENTLRLHYANCKSYNADFDGDEMNAHLPQDQLGQAEAFALMSTENHYLVPKDATPLSGLIQDHIVAGVHLTVRGKFFEKGQYQQLINMSLIGVIGHEKRIKVVSPAIVKPMSLWSGKQIITTILLNLIPDETPPLNLVSKSKVSPKNWSTRAARSWNAGGDPFKDPEFDMGESRVVFRSGELLCGVLDKAQYGGSSYGLVHAFYELYGGKVASALLTSLARLFTVFLQFHGFTLGIGDIICTPEGDASRKEAAAHAWTKGPKAMKTFFDKRRDDFASSDLPTRIQRALFARDTGTDVIGEIDHAMKSVTDDVNNNITRAIIPKGLIKKFPLNNLQLMIQTGAKGSSVNGLQISALLGQIELEGRRPPLMLSCRTLPSFLPFDLTPRAGGFIDGRFLTGIKPQEYFFHCMAGREGLVDTAVKTSRSGYLQRCIIKHMEGISVAYDSTVRNAADGSVVQFAYGEDGLDILMTPYLDPKQFPFLRDNVDVGKEKSHLEKLKNISNANLEKLKKQRKEKARKIQQQQQQRASGFLRYEQMQRRKHPDATKKELVETWDGLNAEIRRAFEAKCAKYPAPLDSVLRPDLNLGVLREKLTEQVDGYVEGLASSSSFSAASPSFFRDYIYAKALRSLAHPGDPVGLLAAQSIGEPSTQMTLNTFHFAGRGEMNVTLGIPRLREILLVAGKEIKTPMMEAPFYPGVSSTRRKDLLRRMNKLVLSDVVENVAIEEFIKKDDVSVIPGTRARFYEITVSLINPWQYDEKSAVTATQIMAFLERIFFPNIALLMEAKSKEIENRGLLDSGRIKAAKVHKEVLDDLDLGEGNLGGSADSDDEAADENKGRNKRQKREREEYGGEDEERGQMDGEAEEEEEEGEAEEGENDKSEEKEDNSGDKEKNDDLVSDGDISSDSDNDSGGGEEEEEAPEPASKKQRKTSSAGIGAAEKKDKDKPAPKKKPLASELRGTRAFGKLPSGQWIVNHVESVRSFKLDRSSASPKWCTCIIASQLEAPRLDLGELVKSEVKRSVVHKVKGINRGFIVEEKKTGETWLRTEGINIEEFASHAQFLDMKRFYTNDVHAMAHFFGIDAARRVLVREITNVFSVYGIAVDPRHLSLVSDYMTFEGRYKALNRLGIASNQSPLQKASFETSMAFLKSALITGAKDDMLSPSARIVTGRLVASGTGCFDLRTNPFKATKHLAELQAAVKMKEM